MHYLEVFQTRATPARVINYVADFSKIQEWDRTVESVEQTTPDPIGLGTLFKLRVRFAGTSVPMVYEITQLTADSHVELIGRGEKSVSIDNIYADAGENPGTSRVRYDVVIELSPGMKWLTPLLWLIFLPSVKSAAAKLKQRLDAQSQ